MRDSGFQQVKAFLSILLLVTAGCYGENRQDSAFAILDSAGITIIENRSPLLQGTDAWSVAETPLLEIGGQADQPEYDFWEVSGVLRLTDGRVLVANGGTQELRYYDSMGRHLSTVGRKGEGPGEFERLSRILLLSEDSILAYDWDLKRLSLFDSAGINVHEWTVPGSLADLSLTVRGTLPGGELLLIGSRRFFTGGSSQIVRDSVPYLRCTRTGIILDTIGWFDTGDSYVISKEQMVGIANPPFARQASVAVFEDRIFTGVGEPYEIRVHGADGDRKRIIRRALPPRPLSRDQIDEFQDPERPDGEEPLPKWWTQALQDFSYPATMPYFNEVMTDREGSLWVKWLTFPLGESDTWDVFDPSGRWVTTVRTPEGFEVRDIGMDYILGVWKDEFDVEYVRMYELRGRT